MLSSIMLSSKDFVFFTFNICFIDFPYRALAFILACSHIACGSFSHILFIGNKMFASYSSHVIYGPYLVLKEIVSSSNVAEEIAVGN